jgi:thiamine pyrophosphokinase
MIPSLAEGFFMPARRALIFANGELRDWPAVKAVIRPGDLLVAADGGAHHLQRLGLTPNVVIGDLDSLAPAEVDRLRGAGVEIRKFPVEKDETDLELALLYAVEQGCRELTILGGLGGRIDQTLANISLLGLPQLAGLDVRMEDGRDEIFIIRDEGRVAGIAGEIVSLLPWGAPARGVTTQGLRYPLHGETLYAERSRGISNELTGDSAAIQVKEGTLICIHTHKVGARTHKVGARTHKVG